MQLSVTEVTRATELFAQTQVIHPDFICHNYSTCLSVRQTFSMCSSGAQTRTRDTGCDRWVGLNASFMILMAAIWLETSRLCHSLKCATGHLCGGLKVVFKIK